jgi:mRNA interferase YafQ
MGYRQQTPAALGRIVKRPVLPRLYDDHPLKGEWAGYREFHADFDWIVIYRVAGRFLVLARTGSHSDLFKK